MPAPTAAAAPYLTGLLVTAAFVFCHALASKPGLTGLVDLACSVGCCAVEDDVACGLLNAFFNCSSVILLVPSKHCIITLITGVVPFSKLGRLKTDSIPFIRVFN